MCLPTLQSPSAWGHRELGREGAARARAELLENGELKLVLLCIAGLDFLFCFLLLFWFVVRDLELLRFLKG